MTLRLPNPLPTEVIVTHPPERLGPVHLDGQPQPGQTIQVAGRTYTILERHHHYQYRGGRYQLQRISLQVQLTEKPLERSLIQGRWVVGDVSCRFNARSELLRCAVNPAGPCAACPLYEAQG